MVQAGILTAPEGGLTEQASATFPVKPLLGVTLMGTWIAPPRHPMTNELPESKKEPLPLPDTVILRVAFTCVPAVL
jgi:hypothetical protein